jgi:hypothetical protein
MAKFVFDYIKYFLRKSSKCFKSLPAVSLCTQKICLFHSWPGLKGWIDLRSRLQIRTKPLLCTFNRKNNFNFKINCYRTLKVNRYYTYYPIKNMHSKTLRINRRCVPKQSLKEPGQPIVGILWRRKKKVFHERHGTLTWCDKACSETVLEKRVEKRWMCFYD